MGAVLEPVPVAACEPVLESVWESVPAAACEPVWESLTRSSASFSASKEARASLILS